MKLVQFNACDARSMRRLWRTLPLWRLAIPLRTILALAGYASGYPEGNIAMARQAWANYFSGFSKPFLGLRLTTVSAEAL